MIKNKKSIHINVDPDDHALFKLQCVKRDLSMQEVFAAFAKRVGLESTDMIRFLDQINSLYRGLSLGILGRTDWLNALFIYKRLDI
mgnify:CR=1 FL=1